MKISDLVRMGLQNLSRRKARTALTVIGVVIGTISIVVMISIGIGMNKQYEEQVMQLGSLTSIIMNSVDYGYDDSGEYTGESTKQVMDDKLIAKLNQIEHITSVVPMHSVSMQLKYKKYITWCEVYGVDFNQLDLLDMPENTYVSNPNGVSEKTMLIGQGVVTYMYDEKYYQMMPVNEFQPGKGNFMYLLQGNYQLADQENQPKMLPLKDYATLGASSTEEMSYYCYVDLKYFRELTDQYIKTLASVDQKKAKKAFQNYDKLIINVDNVDNVSAVQDEISVYGFKTSSLASQLEPMRQTSQMLQTVLGGVGAVAMLVSAISIANTMIMSIYERTKEIGIMKVLGCTISDIKKLFLFEAGMIGLIGGIAGDLISFVASYLINRFGGSMFSALMNAGAVDANLEQTGEGVMNQFSMIPFWLPIMAAGFAMVVGIVSGYYPAKRATKISAIEAMRTEG